MAEGIAHGIPLDPDDVFSALSNSRRRQVILSVSRTGSTVSAGDLAVEIAAQEHVVDPAAVTSEQRTRVYVSLIQGHLEKLDEAGAINYQSRSKEAAPTAATDPLADHIRQITTACYAPSSDADGE